jgi:undecaprenyl-diphosphatase
MSTLEAIILGILQGLTEFLPISSSGHLELGQHLLGLSNLENYIVFNLVCHLGTLFALFIFYSQQIQTILKDQRYRLIQLFIGILPLFPLVLILKPIKSMFDQPQYLGWCFLVTSLLLLLGIQFGSVASQEVRQQRRWRDPFIIGLFQAVAILPGISRSGSTISAGRLLGWTQQDSITFAFLLAIPTILGGITLELLHLAAGKTIMPSIGWEPYLAGFITSFIVGYFALRLLLRLAAKDKFIYFVWYCLILGIVTIFYFS